MPHYTVPESVFAGVGRGTGRFREGNAGTVSNFHFCARSVGLEITQAAFEIVQRAFEHLTKTRVLSGCELLPSSLAGKK